ncbi:MAG: hypothetical protein IIA55_06065 [Gemmatimonadetes bacterium]|nr:hypothetical protein [Gemmatimonadota bacterium]
MTKTRLWLEVWRSEIARRELGTALLSTGAATLVALAVGVVLGRVGAYQLIPPLVVLAWLTAAAAVVWGVRRYRRRIREASVHRLAGKLEAIGGLRRGSVEGVVDDGIRGSPMLFDAADHHAHSWLDRQGGKAIAPVRSAGIRSLRLSAVAGVVGVSLLALSGPASRRGSTFWHPISVLGAARGAVTITLDREEVRRGDSVTVSIIAEGRRTATLWSRAPGEPWNTTAIELDTVGRASTTVGPLDSDRFFRAVSGRSTSETVQVRVAFPAFLSDLILSAEFPAYLERADVPLYPGDSVFLPVGTRIRVQGRATVPISSAAWSIAAANSVSLEVQGSGFFGRTTVRRGGDWELVVLLEAGRKLESANPVLHVVAVPDSAPQITVPVPGVDTTVAPSLRQLLVIDARDDHLLTRIELTTRRASRTGNGGHTETDTIPLPVGGTDRAVLQWVIDLNDRGFLPGDTAYYRVRAVDNAPNPQVSETREFALYLPSLGDIRNAVRDAADDLVSDTDSLLRAQRDLAEATRDLAAEGDRRDDAARGDANDRMDFRSAEEAAEITDEQEQLLDRARELTDQLQELAESGWDAGITDPEWHKRLAELQQMLEQAITPEMQETLEQLHQALEQLDAEAVQELLEQLAEAQEKLREQLERSRELFERAALEGQMSTLADDAAELADRQNQWNESVEDAGQSDSTLAANEAALAAEAERLRDRLDQLQEALDRAQEGGEQVQQSQQSTERAVQQMRQAAQQASQGQQQQARQSGESASQDLESAGDGLREQLEQMRQDWREEVMRMMDDALIETADLAERQQSVEQRLRRGESGGEVRGDQAAIREGVDRVIDRLQNAAGKNALVSPNLSAALGLARLKMTEALQELQEATPNTRQAGERAGRALDGLNEVAYALLRNRGDIEGSESGSGMAEAMEQMAQMAQEQQAMASESGQMLPMMVEGRQELLQQLRELAERQRALGEELERMDAEGAPNAAEQLAEEALQLARDLEAGLLDRETVERQERLFRRLLDAGRTLRSDEEDEREERRSETGDQANARMPPELSGPPGPEARYPYPRWDQLRRFTPEERRLILDYFRRLNAERRQ